MMQTYLRVTFLDPELGSSETFFIKTDDAGKIANSFVNVTDEDEVIDDSYIIRQELLSDQMLRHLEFEPPIVAVYRDATEGNESFVADLLNITESMTEDSYSEKLWNLLNEFYKKNEHLLRR